MYLCSFGEKSCFSGYLAFFLIQCFSSWWIQLHCCRLYEARYVQHHQDVPHLRSVLTVTQTWSSSLYRCFQLCNFPTSFCEIYQSFGQTLTPFVASGQYFPVGVLSRCGSLDFLLFLTSQSYTILPCFVSISKFFSVSGFHFLFMTLLFQIIYDNLHNKNLKLMVDLDGYWWDNSNSKAEVMFT